MTVSKNLCILWMLIVPINIYCCELVVGGALACMNHTQQSTMGYMWPSCKPMPNFLLEDIKWQYPVSYTSSIWRWIGRCQNQASADISHDPLAGSFCTHSKPMENVTLTNIKGASCHLHETVLWAHFSTHHPDECSPE